MWSMLRMRMRTSNRIKFYTQTHCASAARVRSDYAQHNIYRSYSVEHHYTLYFLIIYMLLLTLSSHHRNFINSYLDVKGNVVEAYQGISDGLS